MALDFNIYDLIDKYLRGELKGSELNDFEKRLKTDSELSEEVETQKKLVGMLAVHDRVKKMKDKLNRFHKEIYNPYKNNRTVSLYTAIAVAASISVFVVISSFYLFGWLNYKKQSATYTQLKKDISNISYGQRSLWREFFNERSNEKIATPVGTCFSISSNGYLITNYHVVKDIDSLCIENRKDTTIRYKAKLVYKNIQYDLAVLKIDDENFKSFGKLPYTIKGLMPELGEDVYTLAYSKDDIVYGEGNISSLTGFEGDTIAYEISVPVNPGNSGGPLIDSYGNLIGIICAKNPSKADATFAVRSRYILNVIDSLKADTSLIPPDIARVNTLKSEKRTSQIKKLQPFIFKVEFYQ